MESHQLTKGQKEEEESKGTMKQPVNNKMALVSP